MYERKAFTLATHYSFPLLNNAIYHILPIFQKCCLCSFFLYEHSCRCNYLKISSLVYRQNDYTFEINWVFFSSKNCLQKCYGYNSYIIQFLHYPFHTSFRNMIRTGKLASLHSFLFILVHPQLLNLAWMLLTQQYNAGWFSANWSPALDLQYHIWSLNQKYHKVII